MSPSVGGLKINPAFLTFLHSRKVAQICMTVLFCCFLSTFFVSQVIFLTCPYHIYLPSAMNSTRLSIGSSYCTLNICNFFAEILFRFCTSYTILSNCTSMTAAGKRGMGENAHSSLIAVRAFVMGWYFHVLKQFLTFWLLEHHLPLSGLKCQCRKRWWMYLSAKKLPEPRDQIRQFNNNLHYVLVFIVRECFCRSNQSFDLFRLWLKLPFHALLN